VIGIDAGDSRGPAKSFVEKSGVTFPIAFDPNNTVTNGIFNFATVPETAFVSAKGYRHTGLLRGDPEERAGEGYRGPARLVEAKRSRCDERRDEGPDSQYQPVGARRCETLAQDSVKTLGHRAGGSATATRPMNPGNDVSGTTMPESNNNTSRDRCSRRD